MKHIKHFIRTMDIGELGVLLVIALCLFVLAIVSITSACTQYETVSTVTNAITTGGNTVKYTYPVVHCVE